MKNIFRIVVKPSWLCCPTLVLAICLLIPMLLKPSDAFASSVAVDFGSVSKSGSPLIFGGNNYCSIISRDAAHKAAGFTLVRSDASLESVAPTYNVFSQGPSAWNWTQSDWIIREHNLGFKVLAIIDYCPVWLSHDPGNIKGVPADWNNWQYLVANWYAHYKGDIDYLEVWNEPNNLIDLTNSGYSDAQSAYKAIYDYSYAAIRTQDSNVPIGGPVVDGSYHLNPYSWVNSLLSDSARRPNVNFVSNHLYSDYSSADGEEIDLARAAEANNGVNVPVWETEWNYSGAYTDVPQNNTASEAIPYDAFRINRQFSEGAGGACIFRMSDYGDFQTMDSNGNFYPKVADYRLMSVQLGLGAGASQVMTTYSQDLLSAQGYINSSGQKVVVLANNSTSPNTVSLSLNSLKLSGSGTLSFYKASQDNYALSPFNSNGMTITNGSISTTFTMPPNSTYGVLVSGGTSATSASTNLSFGKTASASTVAATSSGYSYSASNAVDGDLVSGWQSASNDSAPTIAVDLGASYAINDVLLDWGLGYGKSYTIQTASSSGGPWTTAKTVTNANPGIVDAPGLTATARYVRVSCTAYNSTTSGSAIGCSLREIAVYGASSAGTTVVTPTFSPLPGVYSGAQAVTLSTPTSGASINYTTDGSIPSATAGTHYTGPLTVSAGTNINAVAFKSGLTTSALAYGSYAVNTALSVANSGFESPSVGAAGSMYNPSGSGWTFTPQSTTGNVNSGSGIAANGNYALGGDPSAPAGTQVGFIENTASISRQITSTQAGNWTVTASAAQSGGSFSPGGSGLYNQTVEVSIDGSPIGEMTAVSSSFAAYSVTSPTTVTAGTHTLAFTGLSQTQGVDISNSTEFIDNVQVGVSNGAALPSQPTGLAAAASVSPSQVQLTWNAVPGATSYAILRGSTPGSEGTNPYVVGVNGTSYADATLPVGSAYAYQVEAMNDAGISPASSEVSGQIGTGASVSLSDTGFESPSVGAGNYQYNPSGTPWTFTSQGVGSFTTYGSGVLANGSPFNNPASPEGSQAGFVESTGRIDQPVTTSTSGDWTVTLYAAQRPYQSQVVNVTEDGSLIGTINVPFSETSTPSYALYSVTSPTAIAAGTHTLSVQGQSPSDNMEFIDNVQLAVYPTSFLAVANPSFESPALAAGTYQYNPTNASWAFDPYNNNGYAGIAANGSTFTSQNPNAPFGAQVGLLEQGGEFEQSVASSASGTWTVLFYAAQRSGNPGSQAINVFVDQTQLCSLTPSSTAYQLYSVTSPSPISAGTHTVSFWGVSPADNTAFIDKVQVAKN